MAGRVGWVDPRADVDETDQIQAPAEPDHSAELQRTRVWRLDQFVSLGFDLARAAIMADDPAGRASAGTQARRTGLPARDGVPHPPVIRPDGRERRRSLASHR